MKERKCSECIHDGCETFMDMHNTLDKFWRSHQNELGIRYTPVGEILGRACFRFERMLKPKDGGGTSPESLCACGKTKDQVAWRCDECNEANPTCGCGLSLVDSKCPYCRGRTS
jgi:hypothetical protein